VTVISTRGATGDIIPDEKKGLVGEMVGRNLQA
jgi:hypothetical protein